MPAPAVPRDPWLTADMREEALLVRAEHDLHRAVTLAQTTYLSECRAALLSPVTAAGDKRRFSSLDPLRRLERLPGAARWSALLRQHVLPVLKRSWQRAFRRSAGSDGPEQVWQQIEPEYVAAFERDGFADQVYTELRNDLDDASAHADPLDLVRRRVGDVLSLDAHVHRYRDTAARRARQDREYAPDPDESGHVWRTAARQRARWLAVGTTNRATLDAARHTSPDDDGDLFKAWQSRRDERVRMTHAHADQQSVPAHRRFRVGAVELRFPGDPLGPPAEVINCRCRLRMWGREEHEQSNRERAQRLAQDVLTAAAKWSGGACFDNCMDAHSPITACTCHCHGVNHGGGAAAKAGTLISEDDIWPKPSDLQQVLLGWKQSGEPSSASKSRIKSLFQENFTGAEKGALAEDENGVLMKYTGSSTKINEALRETDPEKREQKLDASYGFSGDTVRTAVEALQGATKKGAVPEDTTVFRGLPHSIVKELGTGDVLEDKGFMSTSTDPSVAKSFGSSGGGAVLMVNVPKGSRYASGAKGHYPDECELVLPAGSKVRVLGVEQKNVGGTEFPFIQAVLEEAA